MLVSFEMIITHLTIFGIKWATNRGRFVRWRNGRVFLFFMMPYTDLFSYDALKKCTHFIAKFRHVYGSGIEFRHVFPTTKDLAPESWIPPCKITEGFWVIIEGVKRKRRRRKLTRGTRRRRMMTSGGNHENGRHNGKWVNESSGIAIFFYT